MWNKESFGGNDMGGGGFLNSPSQMLSPSTSDRKRQRAQNVVPVHINEILQCYDETFRVEGSEVGMVVLVGQVRTIDHQATKSVYTIQDETGTIDAIHWIDEDQNTTVNVCENTYCKIVGSVRSQQDKKHVMAFRISPVEMEEVDAHQLEIVHAKLKIRQLIQKENCNIGLNGNLANSMLGGAGNSYSFNGSVGFGGGMGGGGNSFANAKHDLVYKMISGCMREEGMNRDELAAQLKARVNKVDLDNALDFLSGEGHIYSTIDDDHFKTTDA